MYKGTITNTDGSNITAKNVTVNGGEITITMPDSNENNAIGNNDCTVTINGGKVNVTAKVKNVNGDPSGAGIAGTIRITGGEIKAVATGRNGSGIGGYGSTHNGVQSNKSITITGGTIYAEGGNVGIGGGSNKKAELITITGGTITAKGTFNSEDGSPVGIGSGRKSNEFDGIIITGGTINSTFKNPITKEENVPVYLGITPEIENVTDVSVDDKPYYVPGNHENDNKLYLYMTADNHTITVRTKDNSITTYNATYKADGNTANGFFTITQGNSNTPTEKSVISFEDKDYTAVYTPEEHQWEVKLNITLKQTKARLRNAAMSSVQLVLTDDEQDLTYYSDR